MKDIKVISVLFFCGLFYVKGSVQVNLLEDLKIMDYLEENYKIESVENIQNGLEEEIQKCEKEFDLLKWLEAYENYKDAVS